MVGASHLDRCCNKPVISAASLAIGTDSHYESPNPSGTAVICLPFSYFSPKDYMPTGLLLLPGAFLSAKIAVVRQLTYVYEEFLERGQEVSRDLFLASRRNFS